MGIGTDLLAHSEYTAQRTLTRLEGLTDDELRWQPVPGAWTVRRLPDGRTIVDNSFFPIGAPALTSIAWRMAHLVDVYGSPAHIRWVGVTPPTPPPSGDPWPIGWTADESVALLKQAITYFDEIIAGVDEDAWLSKLGPVAGAYADSTLLAWALHFIDEAIHHGAEIGILRDLYASREREDAGEPDEPRSVIDAADRGRWDVVVALVEAGADVNASVDGRTAVHQAAGVGDLALVRFLVEHGARLDTRDPVFGATPLGWAEWFARRDVVDYLKPRSVTTS